MNRAELFGRRFVLGLLDDFFELDPTIFFGRLIGRYRHDEGTQPVLARYGWICIFRQGFAELNGFVNVRLVVSR